MMRTLFVFVLLVFLSVLSPQCLAGEAVVLLPEGAQAEEREAADELAHYWERLSGRAVSIEIEEGYLAPPRQRFVGRGHWRRGLGDGAVTFSVGDTRLGKHLTRDLDGMKPDSIALRSRGNLVVLRGATPSATRIAVYRFLHHAGVRWYMPEAIGEHVPENSLRRPPRLNRYEEPSFASRAWSNLYRADGGMWEKRALSSRNFRFHHNLHRIFTAEVYDEHPEYFILMDGERVRPHPIKGGRNYQICFGNPDAAVFAARKAGEFFDENPDEVSFSLGMNDTFPICECGLCQEIVADAGVFRDRPDYSDLVFTFMNRAAEELGKTHPGKYLGCLAYYWAENTPSFPVHPKVIPYLTADRFQWYDADFRLEDKALMTRWAEAGPEIIGIYDYYYGSSFVIPRLATGITEDSLRHAAANGIEGFYAEIYSAWSLDGPKAWIASQLLWDVSQDRQELLDEYCENFFGNAAVPMRGFFNTIERIWMEQGGPSYWLKFYHDYTQLDLFPPDVCEKLRWYLNWAERLAETELERERVRIFSDGFRITERHSEVYHVTRLLDRGAVDLEPREVVAAMRHWAEEQWRSDRLVRELTDESALHQVQVRNRARFLLGMKAAPLMRLVAQSVFEGDLSAREAAALADDIDEVFPEAQARLALEMEAAISDGDAREILLNGAFRHDALFAHANPEVLTSGYTPFFWERWAGETGHSVIALTDEDAVDGNLSLFAQNAVKETVYQRFAAVPGAVYCMNAYARGRVSPGSRVEIQLHWVDADGEAIEPRFLRIDPLLPGEYRDWHVLNALAEAPENAREGYAGLTVYHQAADDYVYFDGLRLYEWDRAEDTD